MQVCGFQCERQAQCDVCMHAVEGPQQVMEVYRCLLGGGHLQPWQRLQEQCVTEGQDSSAIKEA